LPQEKIPEAIQWHEGMLLTPQHFQQLCLRQETLIQQSALAIQPYLWGVRRLRIDSNLLLGGLFRVLDLEAIMPDGLFVSHRTGDTAELELELKAKAEEMEDHPLPIYLAVSERGDGIQVGIARRYLSLEGEPVADENTGDGEVCVPRLRPQLTLVAAQMPPARCVSFPMAKVQFKDEVFSLADYIPPTMRVPLDSSLGALCSAIAKKVREKAMTLSEQVQSPAAPSSMPLIVENKRKIQCLVAGLPLFESLLSTGQSHPFMLYLALSSMAGHLAALGSSLVPPLFKPYDHNELRAGFEEAQEFAFRMIAEGISETYLGYPFEFSNGIFELAFDRDWSGRRLILAVRAQAGMSEEDVIQWGQECLIGSRSVIQSLRERRILGVSRENIAGEEDLVAPRGVVFFALRASPQFVKPDEPLQLVTVSEKAREYRPAGAVLYVRKAQA
jgi:type VI secretion system protein ImpJ